MVSALRTWSCRWGWALFVTLVVASACGGAAGGDEVVDDAQTGDAAIVDAGVGEDTADEVPSANDTVGDPAEVGTGSGCRSDTVPLGERDDSMSGVTMLPDGSVPIGNDLNAAISTALMSDGRVVAGYSNGYVRIWDFDDPNAPPVELFKVETCNFGRDPATCTDEDDYFCGRVFSQNKQVRVAGVVELADGRIVAGWQDASLRIWDPESPIDDPVRVETGYPVQHLIPLADGRLLAAGGSQIDVWTVDGTSVTADEVGAIDGWIGDIDTLSDGRIAVVTTAGYLVVLDPDTPMAEPAAYPQFENDFEGFQWLDRYQLIDFVEIDDSTILATDGTTLITFDLTSPVGHPEISPWLGDQGPIRDLIRLDDGTVLAAATEIYVLRGIGEEIESEATGIPAQRLRILARDLVLVLERNWTARLLAASSLVELTGADAAPPGVVGDSAPITHEDILIALEREGPSGLYYLGSCSGDVQVQDYPAPRGITPACAEIESSTDTEATLLLSTDEVQVTVLAFRDGAEWILDWSEAG